MTVPATSQSGGPSVEKGNPADAEGVRKAVEGANISYAVIQSAVTLDDALSGCTWQ